MTADQYIALGASVAACMAAIAAFWTVWMMARQQRATYRPELALSLGGERMTRLLKRHRIAAVPHGFRSSFRDWAAEKTDHPREVVEAALAHVVSNKVEAAYRRTDLFDRRRRLMDDWAAYLAGN